MAYGTVGLDVLQSSTAGVPTQFNDGNGTQVGTLCRAWVNFNGTGTVAIRASFNVSSITDNGTGDYTVNFTTALSDTSYSTVATAMRQVDAVSPVITTIKNISNGYSAVQTSSVRVQLVNINGAESLDGQVFVAIFR